ncbi:MAG: group II truncated hemoglobin [Gemmatimonadaceae bacterium]
MTHPTPSTHFEQLGGDAGIRILVDRFYDLMDSAPEAKNVRSLHAASLKHSREKLIMFLTGWTGGPPVYVEKVGPPMLRMRHMPFAISPRESKEWLWCMDHALNDQDIPNELREFLRVKFHELAAHMVNRVPGVTED